MGKGEYLPALINLGNLALQDRNSSKALEYFACAQKLQPDNANVLLSLARVYAEMENADLARTNYEKLKQVDATLAQKFAYLGKTSEATDRASQAGEMAGVVIWEE